MKLSRKALPFGVLLVGGVLLVARAGYGPRTGRGAPHECVLESGLSGWCDSCEVGSLASLRIESEVLFEALDAHGHEVDRASIECEACRDAIVDGSFCDSCGRGYVDGQAYLSRLSYHLARGTVVELSDVTCGTCLERKWCASCARGLVGNVAIDDVEDHALVSEEFVRLEEANALAAKCETCAGAMMVGGMCPKCRIDYARR